MAKWKRLLLEAWTEGEGGFWGMLSCFRVLKTLWGDGIGAAESYCSGILILQQILWGEEHLPYTKRTVVTFFFLLARWVWQPLKCYPFLTQTFLFMIPLFSVLPGRHLHCLGGELGWNYILEEKLWYPLCRKCRLRERDGSGDRNKRRFAIILICLSLYQEPVGLGAQQRFQAGGIR